MFLKNQKNSITWIDPRKAKPPFNNVVLIAFGEDKMYRKMLVYFRRQEVFKKGMVNNEISNYH